MLPNCATALKEWAVVCAALAEGRQTIVLRKGGIAEGSGGFSVEHREFWLYPTRFHQSAEELIPDARPLLQQAGKLQAGEGRLRLKLYAAVHRVDRLNDSSQLDRLDGLHILSRETIRGRFHYRRPGLFVLTLRVFSLQNAHEVAEAPEYAGCHSWVDLGTPLPTCEVQPVVTDSTFREHCERIDRVLRA
jgi:hypothetical protein